jgi:uncharacterized SAM-binding protein YcdF (DUF218 family)
VISSPTPARTSVRRAKWVRGSLILAIVVVAVVLWFVNAGNLLVDTAPPERADAIVVLAGNAPDRLMHAQELFEAGDAPLLVVSDERLISYGLDLTWRTLFEDGLAAPRLPRSAVLIMSDPPPESTLDEARRAADLLQARGLHSAILVTDPFHSRRAELLFSAQFRRQGLSLQSSPAAGLDIDLSRWWQQPRAARQVVEEYAKLVAYGVQGAYF